MDDDDDDLDDKMPGPLETQFYTSASRLEDVQTQAIPSPSNSSAPSVSPKGEVEEKGKTPPLPRGGKFWAKTDTDTSAPKSGGKPVPLKGAEKLPRDGKDRLPQGKEQKESIFGPPGKSPTGKSPVAEEKNPGKAGKPPADKEAGTTVPWQMHPQESHLSQQGFSGEQEKRQKKQQEMAIESSPATGLPAHVIPMAEMATVQAAPYLNPAMVPLFFQMIGRIYVMNAPPGISRTDFVLNSPAFASSRFYGATISIEKYSTAPDSLNIRLTGSTEAVKAFQENIPNLYAAFQGGHFNFRIGRISAEYSAEKPIFKRKDRSDLTDERGDR